MPARPNPVGHFSASPTGSPARIERTVLTYSRISATGLSMVWPCQPSTTGRCETPRPSTTRPPDMSAIVAAVCAMVAGVRV